MQYHCYYKEQTNLFAEENLLQASWAKIRSMTLQDLQKEKDTMIM